MSTAGIRTKFPTCATFFRSCSRLRGYPCGQDDDRKRSCAGRSGVELLRAGFRGPLRGCRTGIFFDTLHPSRRLMIPVGCVDLPALQPSGLSASRTPALPRPSPHRRCPPTESGSTLGTENARGAGKRGRREAGGAGRRGTGTKAALALLLRRYEGRRSLCGPAGPSRAPRPSRTHRAVSCTAPCYAAQCRTPRVLRQRSQCRQAVSAAWAVSAWPPAPAPARRRGCRRRSHRRASSGGPGCPRRGRSRRP